ncbi:iron-siderophore ABC transporter substrate-binding protein [Nocardioides carbamazepini]|uniref:ABC transporter substrate-binding protein n=1 Tax=Nocardioides carbamazepini TaxID=2854259 RepID=UPI00214A0387|nr:iron-siderophore ABC transporter substrate-binding protein [Nocardioides carbamazepini]MCR1781225.1 iron-siderophore ABC transporter substrate-binding protein [Nocardioides carbamazepini]
MPRAPYAARSVRRVALLAAAVVAALSLTACSSEDDAADAGPVHDVEHARGTTAVPEEPKRVVVLEPVQLDTAVALGVTPVGAAVASEETGVPAYLGEAAAEIEAVGTVTEPSLEKIAEQEPDLIIGTESRHSDLYDQLSDIAPTVFMASQEDPWQDNVRLVGEALDLPDEAAALLAEYDERCAAIAEEFRLEGSTAQLVRPRDEAVLSIYGPTSFAGSTLECVGFTIPEQDWAGSISIDISPERILEAQGDHVFVTSTDPSDPSTLPTPVADNAAAFPDPHLVDFSYWVAGVGPLGGQAVLDDIEAILAEGS